MSRSMFPEQWRMRSAGAARRMQGRDAPTTQRCIEECVRKQGVSLKKAKTRELIYRRITGFHTNILMQNSKTFQGFQGHPKTKFKATQSKNGNDAGCLACDWIEAPFKMST